MALHPPAEVQHGCKQCAVPARFFFKLNCFFMSKTRDEVDVDLKDYARITANIRCQRFAPSCFPWNHFFSASAVVKCIR